MKMHLRNTFGVSTTFYTSDTEPIEGTVQGNGEAPAMWLAISIFLIRNFHQQKVFIDITSPISNLFQLLATLLCAEDVDLYVFNTGFEKPQDIVLKAQSTLNA